MLETILFILVGYVLGVTAYTFIVRNNATNKYVPDVKLGPIIKDGALGMLVGFAVVAVLYYICCGINYII